MKDLIKYFDSFFVDGVQQAVVAIVFMLFFVFILNTFLTKLIKKRWPETFVIAMRIKKTVLTFITIFYILSQLKAMSSLTTTLLASGGIFAVMVGLASQEAASNVINGAMIYCYKPYKLFDFISLPEYSIKGKVLDIALRHTIIETLEKTQLVVPNTIMNKAVIENISNVPNNKANHFFIDISYDSCVDDALQIISSLAIKHPLCIDQRSQEEITNYVPQIATHCLEFKDSSILLRATIFTVDNASGFELLSDLRKQVLVEFEKAGIVIPYPHLVVKNK